MKFRILRHSIFWNRYSIFFKYSASKKRETPRRTQGQYFSVYIFKQRQEFVFIDIIQEKGKYFLS